MTSWLATPLLIAIAFVGQFGLVVALHNRINAFGFHRIVIKILEKLAHGSGLFLPAGFLFSEWFYGSWAWPIEFTSLLFTTKVYLVSLIAFLLISCPFWIACRPQFVIAYDRQKITSQKLWRESDLSCLPFRGFLFRSLAKLPCNEVGWTEANHKTLRFDNLPHQLVGLKIGHISDIHLTGRMTNEFYLRAFDWLNEQNVDILVVSGDIVDFEECLVDLATVFRPLRASLGKFFLLGNHDKRVLDPGLICQTLNDFGWHDVGRSSTQITASETSIEIVGNEQPWFQRQEVELQSAPSSVWRIGVAHTPDQFAWGQTMGCKLLLCGHTHGGQIRFPWIGPLVSPSWYGSRFASGVFCQGGTIMHVSRGLSGTHPLRWGCPPEVTVLTLSSAG